VINIGLPLTWGMPGMLVEIFDKKFLKILRLLNNKKAQRNFLGLKIYMTLIVNSLHCLSDQRLLQIP